jgi:hypothetical protein
MRLAGIIAAIALAGISVGQSVTGVWKPWLSHGKVTGKQAALVKATKERLASSSLKLNKDKTFGCKLLDRIMRGTWTLKNGVVQLNVKEVIGMSNAQVQKLSVKERQGLLKLKGKQLMSLPITPGKPAMMWKRIG